MIEAMRCGECGCEVATVKTESKDAFDGYRFILLICVGCKGETMLRPFTAFVLDRDHDSDRGDFTAGWGNSGQDTNVLDKARRQVLEASIGVKTVGPLPELSPEGEAAAHQLVEEWRDEGKIW